MQPLFSVFNTRYFCLPYNVLVFSLLTLECLALKCRQCLSILRKVHYQYLAQLSLLREDCNCRPSVEALAIC